MPSNHLILCRPLLLQPSVFPSIRVFRNESALHIRWPKYWSFSFSISPSNELRNDLLYDGLVGPPCSPKDSQVSFPTSQFKNINSLVLRFLHSPILMSLHRILKEELLRSVGAQYATGDQWRNNSRKNEGMEPKQKQYPVVDVTGDRSKVQCWKEQYCIGTWNVRSMNQGKQEMARVNIDILGISQLKWTGMGEFNSDDHNI